MNPLIWDPDPVAFTLPLVERPVMWYGVLFALAFFFAYLIVFKQLKDFFRSDVDNKCEIDGVKKAQKVIDLLFLWVILGLLLGARLFHVIFYEVEKLTVSPLQVLNAWEGGLASHGGAIGAMLGLVLARRRFKILHIKLSMLQILDYFVPAAALMGVFIRSGNFINQEVLGKAYNGALAVVFMRPIDGGAAFSRHPVQLYEALFFLVILLITPLLKRLFKRFGFGALSGCFIVLTFTFRFWIENFKVEQSLGFQSSFNMGAWLSLPMILLGLFLLYIGCVRDQNKRHPGVGE